MNTVKGLSIWLQPNPTDAARLAAAIGHLAEAHATPVFPAHVTVVGEFERDDGETAESVAELAGSVPPFAIRFAKVGLEDVFWRSLYLSAESSETLTAMRQRACALLGAGAAPYRPHLSLMYSDMDHRARSRIAAHELDFQLPMEVVFDRISLWRIDGTVEQWRQIATFGLADRRRPFVT